MNSRDKSLTLWQGPGGLRIDKDLTDVPAIVNHARALKERETEKIAKAFADGYFDMGTEFIWRKAMSRLKRSIASLGMKFVGEMLDRKDIDEFSSPENVLTDYDAIKLAESLGIISGTGAMRLRHSFELMFHFFADQLMDDEEELSMAEAINVVRHCVQYVLGDQDIGVAADFSYFRKRLTSEALKSDDSQVQQLLDSPPFFSSTVLRILVASVKTESGARLENVLSNIQVLLSVIWKKIPEEDKWVFGSVYSDAVASGDSTITNSLKKALLAVGGFDYVPETVRSESYKKTAQAVINAHFSFNNFYLEEGPIKQLSAMGSRIPKAAFSLCLQAYLCVYLGNVYGHSFAAAPIAERELGNVSNERWEYYFNRIIQDDDKVVFELTNVNPAKRFVALARELHFEKLDVENPRAKKLLAAALADKLDVITDTANRIYLASRTGEGRA